VNPTNFFAELKRRNVYRAAIAYGVVAWFLTQLTTQVLPLFEIPNSAMRFVVIALAVGFPIAMLLAWVYEFTPEGIVRTEDLQPARVRRNSDSQLQAIHSYSSRPLHITLSFLCGEPLWQWNTNKIVKGSFLVTFEQSQAFD
jgi:hypothetical protein